MRFNRVFVHCARANDRRARACAEQKKNLESEKMFIVFSLSFFFFTFKTAMHRPTITSSLTFSITQAASPATSASSTGALYKFQNRKSSPRDAVVLPTCPNKFAVGSQKIFSKHNTTCNRGEEKQKKTLFRGECVYSAVCVYLKVL